MYILNKILQTGVNILLHIMKIVFTLLILNVSHDLNISRPRIMSPQSRLHGSSSLLTTMVSWVVLVNKISIVLFTEIFSGLQVPLVICFTVSVSEASPDPDPLLGLLGKNFTFYTNTEY